MSEFMDDIAEDVDDVFFDIETFGAVHNVNGADIPVLLQNLGQLEMSKRQGERRDDIHKDNVLLYIRKSDIGEKRLKVNSILTLDGKKLFVHDVKDSEGIFRVMLGRRSV